MALKQSKILTLIKWVVKLFSIKKKCDHRFDAKQVHDLNDEPKCKRCGMYFGAICSTQMYAFKIINEKEYGLQKLKFRR